jgi:hypothetical protein
MSAREDWKVGDVLVCLWGENEGEQRTIREVTDSLSLDDGIVLDVVFNGSDVIHHQPYLIEQGWRLLKGPEIPMCRIEIERNRP